MLLDKETVTAAELLLVSSVVTFPSLRRDPSFDGYDFSAAGIERPRRRV